MAATKSWGRGSPGRRQHDDEWYGVLVLDFTGEPKAAEKYGERHSREVAERRTLGKGRVRRSQRFHVSGRLVVLEAGAIVDIVEPNERDRSDLEHYARTTNKQHVVIRWQHGVSLLLGADVERLRG